ncbi:hypothetical protein ES703_86585 [subsurface metagenome]
MALPESVKTSRVSIAADTSMGGVPFPMHLGDNEVAVLLSIWYFWYGAPTAASNIVYFGLWRKTDSDPSAMGTAHTDMLWRLSEHVLSAVGGTVRTSGKGHVILPWPLILIRPPRLVGLRAAFASATVDMQLFYTIQKVSDEELAKLMVKDHA